MRQIPCKDCLCYPICQNTSIWDKSMECDLLIQFIIKEPKVIFGSDVKWTTPIGKASKVKFSYEKTNVSSVKDPMQELYMPPDVQR